MLRYVFKSDVRQQTVMPKVCCLWPFNVFFFVYQCFLLITEEIILFMWIGFFVTLFHYHTKMLIFFNKVSLEVKVLLLTHSKTKAEVQRQISNCWLHFSFRYKYARYFFVLFQKYFSFRNSTLAFKNYSWCRFSFSSKDLSALRVRK